jgi:hypothetical protein
MPVNGGRWEREHELTSSSADWQSRRATSIELRTTFVLDCSPIHPVACDVNRHHTYTRTVALMHALNVDLLSPKIMFCGLYTIRTLHSSFFLCRMTLCTTSETFSESLPLVCCQLQRLLWRVVFITNI